MWESSCLVLLQLFVSRVSCHRWPLRFCTARSNEIPKTGDCHSVHQLFKRTTHITITSECWWCKVWRVCNRNGSHPRYNFQIIKLKCYIFFLPLTRKSLWVRNTSMNRRVNPDENNNKRFLKKSRKIRMRYCAPVLARKKKRKLKKNVGMKETSEISSSGNE